MKKIFKYFEIIMAMYILLVLIGFAIFAEDGKYFSKWMPLFGFIYGLSLPFIFNIKTKNNAPDKNI